MLRSAMGDLLHYEPLAGERIYREWWSDFGRDHGLTLLPSYPSETVEVTASGEGLALLRREVESIRAAWSQDSAVTERPPDPQTINGRQLLVHLLERSDRLLAGIATAEATDCSIEIG